ncbi:unnamed protein product [Alopecurus aequalis]
MGNAAALGEMLRSRPAVEERLTRPQRLVRQLSDLDSGRLRRLIRSGDLAPCFDADDEHNEECPICFYFYPSLNRSKCCGKGICTGDPSVEVLLAADAVQGLQSCPLSFLQNHNLRCRIPQCRSL